MAAANYPDQGSAFTQPEPITYSDYSRILEFLDRIRAKPFSYIDVFNTFARRNPR